MQKKEIKEIHSYFKGNEVKKIDEILNLLDDDKSIAMISDAGTPLISDPGSTLVKELIKSKENIHENMKFKSNQSNSQE